MLRPDAAELARCLAGDAEAVCRRYLPHGRPKGRYWLAGDVHGAPGRSLFVRLTGPGSGKGAAGRWTDAATGQHGDLLDLIRHACGLVSFGDVLDEACRFLSLPCPGPRHRPPEPQAPVPSGSPDAGRRLFAASHPLAGSLAETYLRDRGLVALHGAEALRCHPRCFYRHDDGAKPETWPAMVAAVTDLQGALTGVQRTFLARDGSGKAPVDAPRRAMGALLSHAVRFGAADDVLAAGEGIETLLSLRCALPALPVAAALSATNLVALSFPAGLRRLYVARDADAAGRHAADTLTARAQAAGIDAVVLSPRRTDFNDDLVALGIDALRAHLRVQIAPEDVARFLSSQR